MVKTKKQISDDEKFLRQPRTLKFWPKGVGHPSVAVRYTVQGLLQDDLTFTNSLPDKTKNEVGRKITNLAFGYFDIIRTSASRPRHLGATVKALERALDLGYAKKTKEFVLGILEKHGAELAQDALEDRIIFDQTFGPLYKKVHRDRKGYADRLVFWDLNDQGRRVIAEALQVIDMAFEKEQDFPAIGQGTPAKYFDREDDENIELISEDDRRRLSEEDAAMAGVDEDQGEEYVEEEYEDEDEETIEERLRQEDIDAGYDSEYYEEVAKLQLESPGHEHEIPSYYSNKAQQRIRERYRAIVLQAQEAQREVERQVEDDDDEDDDMEDAHSAPKLSPLEKATFATILKNGGPAKRGSLASTIAPPKTGNPFQRDTSIGNLGSPTKKKVGFSSTSPTKSAGASGGSKRWDSVRDAGVKKVKAEEGGLRRSERRKSK